MKMIYCCLALLLSVSGSAYAVEQFTYGDTRVTTVFVNGGVDTANPGTSCIKLSININATCEAGLIAIPNNNSELLSAALALKATGGRAWIYHVQDTDAQQHCPGVIVTSCSLVSIGLVE